MYFSLNAGSVNCLFLMTCITTAMSSRVVSWKLGCPEAQPDLQCGDVTTQSVSILLTTSITAIGQSITCRMITGNEILL